MMRRILTLLALAAFVLMLATATRADDVAKARQLFQAGARAYTAGNYKAAIQAFEQAYELAPRTGLAFSMAQAHRRQYYAAKQRDPRYLRRAIELYREYLERAPQGKRRHDATEALSELEPIVERIDAEAAKSAAHEGGAGGDGGGGGGSPQIVTPPDKPAKPVTRLMVTSPVIGARISLDGGPPEPQPLIREVTPGSHIIAVSAEGYVTVEQQVEAVKGDLVPHHVPLREQDAQLHISVPDGCDVTVDGLPLTVLAGKASLSTSSGSHLVAVTMRGHHPFAKRLSLKRGERRQIEAMLEPTSQHVASYFVLGASAATLTAGVVALVVAAARESEAFRIWELRKVENITLDQAEEYDDARDDRNAARLAGGILLGSGASLAVAGVIMFLFDSPTVTFTSESPAADPAAGADELPAGEPPPPELEISAVPWAGPDLAGAALRVRF